MDAVYFLKQRTDFIRLFFDGSEKSFIEVKRRIEAEEPPYLEQWLNAEVALDLVGLSCISLLSNTLKLDFQTLEKRVIGFVFPDEHKKRLLGCIQGGAGSYSTDRLV
jgi:hypothetical protein